MNNLKQLGLGLHNYHDTMNRFPSALTFIAGSPDVPTGIGSPLAAILPYLEQKNVQDLLNPEQPWIMVSPTVAKMTLSIFLCPSDTGPSPYHYPFFDSWGLPVGSTFGSSSYGISKGVNDAHCLSAGFGPPPTTAQSGLFDFNTFHQISEISDGTSNTFMMGEAATGFPICDGIGCTTRYKDNLSVHFWLVGGHSQPGWVIQGFVYSGNNCSTVERLNKVAGHRCGACRAPDLRLHGRASEADRTGAPTSGVSTPAARTSFTSTARCAGSRRRSRCPRTGRSQRSRAARSSVAIRTEAIRGWARHTT